MNLFQICRRGDVPALQRWIDVGEHLEPKDLNDWTPLMHASANGVFSCVSLLLKAGVHANHQDKCGNSALSLAAYHGHLKCVLSLLDAGATVDLLDAGGSSPLRWAVICGHNDCIRALLIAGANPNQKRSPNAAEKSMLDCACSTHQAEALKLLLEYGADLDSSLVALKKIREFPLSDETVQNILLAAYEKKLFQNTPRDAPENPHLTPRI